MKVLDLLLFFPYCTALIALETVVGFSTNDVKPSVVPNEDVKKTEIHEAGDALVERLRSE